MPSAARPSAKTKTEMATTTRPPPAESAAPCCDEHVCRICLENAVDVPLLSPCRCSGTHAHVHETCLRQWVETTTLPAARTTCQLCQTRYATFRPAETISSSRWPRCKRLKRWVISSMTSMTFLGIVIVGVSILIADSAYYVVCNDNTTHTNASLTADDDDPADGMLIVCGSAFVQFCSAYIAGSAISVMILAMHATCFVLARGCRRYWGVVCARSRHSGVSFVAIMCFFGAYMLQSTVLQSTGVYLVVVSAIYKSIWSIHGERHAARFLLQLQPTRYQNYVQEAEDGSGGGSQRVLPPAAAPPPPPAAPPPSPAAALPPPPPPPAAPAAPPPRPTPQRHDPPEASYYQLNSDNSDNSNGSSNDSSNDGSNDSRNGSSSGVTNLSWDYSTMHDPDDSRCGSRSSSSQSSDAAAPAFRDEVVIEM
jgi:hypothetical protein